MIYLKHNKGENVQEGLVDKRVFPRVRLKTPVYYQIRGNPGGQQTLSDDISLGGIAISDNRFVPTQTVIGLKINILSKIINPIGVVAWQSRLAHSTTYRIGIQFVELDPKDKMYLSDYISLQKLLI